ncbi:MULTISPECIES: type IIL restriction-modification enzyme MmeI [Corynebacterium]|uniref:type IIL restriction-modification enzyme MmeI n=1 Tax=Corynebacterium TaxID=1716 RepID=UPI001D166537|nr:MULTISPECIES: type IIL restriction-modification enzyme MmeI [Corynebacterium]
MTSSYAVAALDRGDIRKNLTSLVSHWRPRIDEWKSTGKRHTEKSHAQQFWSDLLRSFGVIPERIDLFERDAARASTGNTGYIDLFWSGVVLGEAKSLGRDLDAAFSQALDYLAGGSIEQHEWPNLSAPSLRSVRPRGTSAPQRAGSTRDGRKCLLEPRWPRLVSG